MVNGKETGVSNDWRLEQHVGTIMQILVVGLLGWSMKTNVDLRAEVAVLNAKVEAMSITLAQGTTARDLAAVWAELSRQSVRMDKLESKQR